MADRPNLPSPDEYSAVWTKLYEVVQNDLEEPDTLPRRVFEATNYEDEQEVTYEHVASTAVFGRDLQSFAEQLKELGEKLEYVALEELEAIRREGRMPHVPKYDKSGYPGKLEDYLSDDDVAKAMRRVEELTTGA